MIWKVILPILHRYECFVSAVQKVKQPRKVGIMAKKMNFAYFQIKCFRRGEKVAKEVNFII